MSNPNSRVGFNPKHSAALTISTAQEQENGGGGDKVEYIYQIIPYNYCPFVTMVDRQIWKIPFVMKYDTKGTEKYLKTIFCIFGAIPFY